jgi:hypothetical protein
VISGKYYFDDVIIRSNDINNPALITKVFVSESAHIVFDGILFRHTKLS